MPLTIEYRPIVLPPELRVAPPAAVAVRAGEPLVPVPPDRSIRPWRRFAAPALLGAMALGAASAWSGSGIPAPQAHAATSGLQPFETAGENFPGSAFYYLDAGSGVVSARPGSAAPPPSAEARPLDARLGDAIARPTFLAGSSEDKFRALQCLTAAIYYEAATEPDAGQRAVAQVVLNRVAHPLWPNSVCGVVYQGSERPGCQFSFACDGSMARAPARAWWLRARGVAEKALAGEVYAPVGLATYYHTGAVNPPWASRQVFIGAIGAHLFYRPPGAQGTALAYTDRYWGGEPSPMPKPRIAPLAPLPSASAPIDRRFSAEAVPALPAALPSLAPPSPPQSPAGVLRPESGRVREEYRNSGRWLAKPDR